MPDNYLEVQKDLINELLNNIPAGYDLSRIKLPNAPFDTPSGEKWLRVTFNLNPKENVFAGGFYKRQFGILTVDIFTVKGTGDLEALNDLNAIKSIYENKNIGAAKCETVSPNPINTEENWHRVQADVVFYYEGY